MPNKSRKEKATLKREEILVAAKELFARQGYHATSTRSINAAIGGSDGLMYHYFPGGKKELLLAVVEHELNIRYDFFKEKSVLVPADLPLEDFLRHMIGMAMENLSRDSDIFIILMREAQEISQESTAIIKVMFTDISHFLKARFESYIRAGVVRDLDVFGMIHQLASSLHTYALLNAATDVFHTTYSKAEYTELVVGHMLKCWQK